MFLREPKSSDRKREEGRGIRNFNLVRIVIVVAALNVYVARQLIFISASPLWIWLQVAAAVALVVSIVLLIRFVRKHPSARSARSARSDRSKQPKQPKQPKQR